MAQAYTAIPQGALFNIPEALPQGLLYRYKKISNISRQNMKLQMYSLHPSNQSSH